MSATLLSDVSNQVAKFWSPMFMDELMESTLLASLVNKQYQGDLKRGGDTVYVSQINRPNAELKTIGTDAESFSSSLLSTSRVAIQANKRITAAYELEDAIDLLSILDGQGEAIRKTLMEAAMIKLNEYLYSFVSPSTSAPNHLLSGVSDFNAAALNNVRTLAAQAKWKKDGGWWLLASPSYKTDLLNAATLTSSDYVQDTPVVGGQMVSQRFGFNILEDNSDALVGLYGTSGTDHALAFHPDFLHLVMAKQPEFKISSLHSNKQHGYIISLDFVCGCAAGIDSDVKHVVTYNS